MSSDVAPEQLRVQYGPTQDRSLLLGMRADQLGALASGLLVAAWTFSHRPDLLGVAFAAAAVCAGVSVAFVPVEGRTLGEWLPVLTVAVIDRARGHWRHTATTPLDGHGSTVDAGVVWPPPPLSMVRILQLHDQDGHPMGAVVDRATGTYTAVAPVTGQSFYLADPGAVERRICGWGSVLQAVAAPAG